MTDEQQAKEMEEKISRLQACQDKLDNLELYATAKVGSITVTRIPEGLIYGVGSTAVFVNTQQNESTAELMEWLMPILKINLEKLSKVVPQPSTAEKLFQAVAPDFKGTPVAGAAPKKASTKKAAPKKAATKK